MNTRLYKEIFGEHATATNEQLMALDKMVAALPENVFYAVHEHYYNERTQEEIAAEVGKPVGLIERWRMHGINFLKIWNGIEI